MTRIVHAGTLGYPVVPVCLAWLRRRSSGVSGWWLSTPCYGGPAMMFIPTDHREEVSCMACIAAEAR